MSKELVIDVTASEIAIALLENKQLVELNKQKSNVEFNVGNIYLGKVKKIMPGLNAAFVDVGYEKDAFLHYLDLGPQFQTLNKFISQIMSKKGKNPVLQRFRPENDIAKDGKIGNVLSTGQSVLVQIAKEPISTKGPRLSSEISIAGRNLVLIPFSDKVSVSQKIESAEERTRLKRLLQSIKPRNYGLIVRTVAEGKRVAELDYELKNLVMKWESVYDKFRGATAPRLALQELDRTSTILRDLLNVSFNNIYVNDEIIVREIKEYINTIAPEKKKIVKYYSGKTPIFDHFGVEKQIKSLFGKTVSCRNGAYLIIEHTEALHVIDVNSGNRSKSGDNQEANALAVNLIAAEEIARQLRLRDMGGIIVVDFIDMQSQENKQMLFDKMKEFMSDDRTKHNILPLSKFGLMQLTRQRVRPEMSVKTMEKCPTCRGTGEINPSILFTGLIEEQLQSIIERSKTRNLVLKVHPFIEAYLTKGIVSKRLRWILKYRCFIKVMPMISYHFMEYSFFTSDGEEFDQNL
ncbi:MAG: Rne/Rng family ribonuclease [Bacteroidales bacterium]